MTPEKSVGQRAPRQDALVKSTGAFVYGMDFQLPGQLYGAILRSPHPHALIRSVDASRARELEGVEAVLTAQDLPPGLLMPGVVADQPLLATERARYHGEPIAAVAAQSLELAYQALDLISVDYQPLPTIVDAEIGVVARAVWQRDEGVEKAAVEIGGAGVMDAGNDLTGFHLVVSP